MKELHHQLTDLSRQREAALREVAELKTQLKLVEETRDAIRRDLIEANRKIREGEKWRLINFLLVVLSSLIGVYRSWQKNRRYFMDCNLLILRTYEAIEVCLCSHVPYNNCCHCL